MMKYLVALMVLLSVGVAGAELSVCTDCYANIITQEDTQTIENVKIGEADLDDNAGEDNVAIGNEGLSAAIIVTPAVVDATSGTFKVAPFARIDQKMDQKISGLGVDFGTTVAGTGAKGVTWNKAIQAAWIANQGLKEKEGTEAAPVWKKEGAYVLQDTTQLTQNIYDYDSREGAKVLNVDNKLAMIVDNLAAIIDLSATANSATTDSQSSAGDITNTVDVDVDAQTTGYPPVVDEEEDE
jgi:hypothetical protein